MNSRRLLWLSPVAAAAALGLIADRLFSAAGPHAARGDPRPAATLPVSQVVLFNSGVGYFAEAARSTATPGWTCPSGRRTSTTC